MFDIWQDQINKTIHVLEQALEGRDIDYSQLGYMHEPDGETTVSNRQLYWTLCFAFNQGRAFRDKEIAEKIQCSGCGESYWREQLDYTGECLVCLWGV